jgi:MRG-binding protein
MTNKEFEWGAEADVSLLQALRGHKPIGIGKHFQMLCIMEKFKQSVGKPVTATELWVGSRNF